MPLGVDGLDRSNCPLKDRISCDPFQFGLAIISFFQASVCLIVLAYNIWRPLKISMANYFIRFNNALTIFNALITTFSQEGSYQLAYQMNYTYLVGFHILVLSVVLCQIEILKAMIGLRADSSWLKKDHLTRLQVFFVVMYFICNIGLFMKSQSLGYTTSIDSWYYELLSIYALLAFIYEEVHNIYVYQILTVRWKELMDLKNAKEAGGMTDKGTKTEGGGWNISLNMNALKSVSSSSEAQDSGNGEQGVVIKDKVVEEDHESTKRTLVEISGISTLRYLIITTFISDTVAFLIIIYGLFFLANGVEWDGLGLTLISFHTIFVSLILYSMKNLGLKKYIKPPGPK